MRDNIAARFASDGQMNISAFCQHFEKLFGASPRVYRAPGRVNVIGEHTDYNDGFVMPAAIEFSTNVGIAPRPDRKIAIHSRQFPDHSSFELDHIPRRRTGSWCDYVIGVARELQQRAIPLSGSNMLVQGEVPIGSGLSSSAALEVASACALLGQAGSEMPGPEIAKLCRQAENNFVGARVGIMDQFVSCMGKAGHAILLDCRSLDFQFVPIPNGVELVICNTMVKHDHAAGTYNSRRAECEEGVRILARRNPAIHALRDVSVEMLKQYANDLPPIILKRCSHVIYENQRTLDAARALAIGDLVGVSELMRASHASLRDLYEVSSRELDIMVDAAQGLPGFIGGRMTGGGFGGCTVNLVREENARDFAEKIAERYRVATGIESQTYICAAEDGAQEITHA